MKKLIICILFTLCLFSSCTIQDEPIEEAEYVELYLRPRGIDFSFTPMETKSPSSDIYTVCVFKENGDEWMYYATWVTDDITSEKIMLLKGGKYVFCVMYIPDGQNIVAGRGKAPFWTAPGICPYLGDGICYGTNYRCYGAEYGAVKKKEDKESGQATNGYRFNDVDRYHGTASVVASENITLDVYLYRQMFELDIVVTNFAEGTILVYSSSDDAENNSIVLTPTNPSISTVRELYHMPWGGDGDESWYINHTSECYFNIDYLSPNGKTITIMQYHGYIKRLTKLNVSIDLQEVLSSIQASLNPKVVTNETWTELTL